jgi:Tol biopolymer transport system component
MLLSAGARLGPYEVIAPLGAGGMGEVYQARDHRLNRQVALKVLPAGLMTDEDRRRRFVQEAQLASSLQHPHIVTIYDIGTAAEGDYLAMELVRGRTLDVVVPKKGLRLPEALRYAIQIADALAAAHGAGIVHRDLKPGNIMVTDQGQIKILDFGLATLSEAQPEAASSADETRAVVETGANTILGTVAYMSPEQAEGRKVDARSDLFSFGAILYEMLSGRRAFRADSMPGTLAAVINLDPPPLATVADDVPQPVERLVSRCLRKDLARRAQHASDIKVALEELQEDTLSGSASAAAAVEPRPRPWRRGLLAAGLALLALAGAVAAVAWWPRDAPAPVALSPVPLTSLPGTEGQPTFSPDGTQIAFMWVRQSSPPDVYAQVIGGGSPALRLTDDGGGHSYPAWSPDGKFIALWHFDGPNTPGNLAIVSPLGGPERRLLEWTGSSRRIAWSIDSQWLAVSPVNVRVNLDKGITLVSVATGERIEWAAIDPVFARSADPAFSPDGSRLAYLRVSDDFSADLYVVSVNDDGRPGGQPIRVPYGGTDPTSPVWTADGRDLLVIEGVASSNGGVVRVPADGSRPGERIPGLEGAARTAGLTVARAGQRLAMSRDGLDAAIWRVDLKDPAASGPIAASTLHDEGADFSSDDRRIAFSSNRLGAREIWVADVTGEQALSLTNFGGPVPGTARWSPDDRLIAFDGRPHGNSEIFVVAATGGALRQLTTDAGEDARPAWSHDGQSIYFSSTRSGRNEIWRMTADGRDPVQVTRGGGSTVAVAPDGTWLYYQRPDSPFIHRIRPDGTGDSVAVAENTRFLALTTTARGLWFLANPAPGSGPRIRVLRFSDNTITDAAALDFFPLPVGMSVSADERYVLVSRADSRGGDLLLVNGFR